MRLYRYISPILLILLVTGFCINEDSLSINDYGNNEIREENLNIADQLKKQLDDRIMIYNDSISKISEDGYKLVQTAYKEIGNVGGEKYWSWYGFKSYVSWCCCFVSWCADQCGFIESGVIPKFSSVSGGLTWFANNGQWIWGYEEPSPGMIIFFDFANRDLENIRDGIPDHVGIVKCVKDNYVYCIEGNYNNTCQETKYRIGDYNIYGYGVPIYGK